MVTTTTSDSAVKAFPSLEALGLAGFPVSLPDFIWATGDDKCDCIFQRIGFWTNPYLAVTHEIRLCCLYAEFAKVWPDIFRTTQAYWDGNIAEWVENPAPWDNEDSPMPVSIWHRQIARKTGKTLAEVRAKYRGRESERPKAVPWYRGKKYKQPGVEALKKGREAHLRHTGWIVGSESIPIKSGEF